MEEFKQEQNNREEAMMNKNERIRDLEMEVARATQAMQSKDTEINRTKSKLVDAEESA